MKLKTTYWMLLLTIIFTLAFAYGWETWVVMKIQEYVATLLDFHPRRYMAVGPILFSFVFFVIDMILALVFFRKALWPWGCWLAISVWCIAPFYLDVFRAMGDVSFSQFNGWGDQVFITLYSMQIFIAFIVKILFERSKVKEKNDGE